MLAEQLGVDPTASPRKRRRTLIVTLALCVVTAAMGWASDYFSVGPFASAEHEAQKENDATESPFIVSMRPEKSEPRAWALVLDRELSAPEARKMTSSKDSSAAFSYLTSLGGRALAYAPLLENAPKRYQDRQITDGTEFAAVFKLNILSVRDKAVVIDDWEVVDARCEPSTAKTVVAFPPQGGAAYEGIRLHIPPRADEPVLTDDADGQGEPYFSTRRMEVGGGQPSGGLRVEAIASAGRSCTWGIKVHYVDAYQNDGYVRLKDGKGGPLVLHAESVPRNPRQKWVSGSVPWTACHEEPQEPMCDAL
ncbi:hypothetical protein [Streptomyces sp. MI02-7b]|uniref:hypothetical protein n=1 Tax=Streptomyces sp. MI02-7b TaxID=462941 RepID=UPI0029BD00D0|nr:hypothetical protein [Streptomyces sp. MI02-7b]MDX3077496.1 hypothetical protein [Streptomyces sp. MI02-7b]